jgi:hypothetical protein
MFFLYDIYVISQEICIISIDEKLIESHLISVPLLTYGSTVLVDLGRFFSFLIYTQ